MFLRRPNLLAGSKSGGFHGRRISAAETDRLAVDDGFALGADLQTVMAQVIAWMVIGLLAHKRKGKLDLVADCTTLENIQTGAREFTDREPTTIEHRPCT